MSQLSVIIDWKDLCLFSITMEEVGTKSQVRLFTLLMKVKNTKKIHDAVSDFHLVWYFTVLFDWTYVGYPVRKLVRLTIICVLWSKRSRMQKTYLKLFKHFQWSVCNVALNPLVTSNASTMWFFSCYNIFLSDSLDCFSSAIDPTVSDLKPFVFIGDPPINQQSLLELLLLYVLWPAGLEIG